MEAGRCQRSSRYLCTSTDKQKTFILQTLKRPFFSRNSGIRQLVVDGFMFVNGIIVADFIFIPMDSFS